jgi:hypothetical protein
MRSVGVGNRTLKTSIWASQPKSLKRASSHSALSLSYGEPTWCGRALMRSIAARMFDGCGSSRNFASQFVAPVCAAGTPAAIVKVAIAMSAPERRFMSAPGGRF